MGIIRRLVSQIVGSSDREEVPACETGVEQKAPEEDLRVYWVKMDRDGNAIELRHSPDDHSPEVNLHVETWVEEPPALLGWVPTTDESHALEIANATRIGLIAEGKWPPLPDPLRINLGSGPDHVLPNYINVDRCFPRGAPLGSITKIRGNVHPLPWAKDESIQEVRASHILEHFGHREVPAVLQEWVRVLRPGGVLRIAVPDLEWIATNYIAGVDAPFQGYLMGGQVDENDFHRSVWDAEMLRQALEHYGLVDVQEWKSEVEDCAALPCSLNLQGTKPGGPDPPQEKWGQGHLTTPAVREAAGVPRLPPKSLRLLLSAPRLGFTDNMFCAYEAAVQLGCPLTRNCGVYWHQATENLLEEAERDGFRYAVVFDYDSVFTAADVYELYRLAEAHPEADAIMGLQMRREKDAPLLSVVDEGGAPRNRLLVSELQGDLLRAASGHLGLTLFRLASLARVPHPWFQAVPDAEGRWGEGRQDADVHLWTAMREAGLSLYLAPRVVVGHLQMLVTWPSREFRPTHQYPSDYVAGGKPEGAWR